VGELSNAESGAVRASLPTQPAAARAYAEGLSLLRAWDARAAREKLEAAVRAEPDHPLPHWALAQTLELQGELDGARTQARLAFDHAAALGRDERLAVEARLRRLDSEWDRAITLYRNLLDLYPDDVEHGLELANAQMQAGRPDQASATLAAL